jgi:hypothetical protein
VKLDWHFAETRRIAQEVGFAPCQALWLAIGDCSVDLRHWTTDCAHGMTPVDTHTGQPTIDPDIARAGWQAWIDHHVRRASQQLEDRPHAHAPLYFMGLALHAIQDQEAHQGMTNTEHARRSVVGDDPDVAPAALERGAAVTCDALERFARQIRVDAAAHSRCHTRRAYAAFVWPPERAPMNINVASFVWLGRQWSRREPTVIRWAEQPSRSQ